MLILKLIVIIAVIWLLCVGAGYLKGRNQVCPVATKPVATKPVATKKVAEKKVAEKKPVAKKTTAKKATKKTTKK